MFGWRIGIVNKVEFKGIIYDASSVSTFMDMQQFLVAKRGNYACRYVVRTSRIRQKIVKKILIFFFSLQPNKD
jgi:hypothetical protein